MLSLQEVLSMNCTNCQTANPEGARFCFNCGNVRETVRPVEGERSRVR